MTISKNCVILTSERKSGYSKSGKEMETMTTTINLKSYFNSERFEEALDIKQGLNFICSYKVRRKRLYV